jgi:hypothetical protein
MTMNVTLVVATVAQEFPAGTVDTPFTFTITDPSGTVKESTSTSATTFTFSNIADGSYIAVVAKNGVSVNQTFTVVTPNVSLQVPASITVTFA